LIGDSGFENLRSLMSNNELFIQPFLKFLAFLFDVSIIFLLNEWQLFSCADCQSQPIMRIVWRIQRDGLAEQVSLSLCPVFSVALELIPSYRLCQILTEKKQLELLRATHVRNTKKPCSMMITTIKSLHIRGYTQESRAIRFHMFTSIPSLLPVEDSLIVYIHLMHRYFDQF
jgi:hypothetical protein